MPRSSSKCKCSSNKCSAAEPDEVQPHKRFFADLGGDSLDILDLTFRLEKQFNIKLRLDELRDVPVEGTRETGVLSADGLARLKERCPFLDFTALGDRPMKGQLMDLLTIEALAHFVCVALLRGERFPADAPRPQRADAAAESRGD